MNRLFSIKAGSLLVYLTQVENAKRLLSRVLACGAILYLVSGLYFLVVKNNDAPIRSKTIFSTDFSSEVPPVDFKLRRVEAKYFMERLNPYDIFDKESSSKKSFAYQERLQGLAKETGIPITISAYPLWAFPIFVISFTPFLNCGLSRFVFALLNILAFYYMYKYIFRYSSAYLNRGDSHLVCRSCMALNAWYITLHNGQISALLAAAVLLSLPNSRFSYVRQTIGNIILSIKFTFGAYPLLVLFFTFKKQVLLSAGTVIFIWIGSSLWLHDNPVLFFRQMFLMPTEGGIGLCDIFSLSFLTKSIYLLILFILGLLATLFIVLRHRSDAYTKCALALILMRLFCYHQIYDNIMIFMGISILGIRSLQSRNRIMTMIWLSCLFAFALPSSFLNKTLLPYFYIFFLILTFVAIYVGVPSSRLATNKV